MLRVIASFLLIATVTTTALGAKPADPGAKRVMVAVASNFSGTQDALAARFEEKTGKSVMATSGASGKLYAQIKNGAPFDIFLSADEAYPQRLESEGACVKDSRFTYAVGKLVLYSALPELKPGGELLTSPAVTHLAIANPETAPYGSAAVAVLKKLGAYDGVKDKLVFGENIAQTFQFAQTKAAEAAFVAYSQVLKEPADRYWIVPAETHAPIKQDALLLTHGEKNPTAKAYLKFLRSPEAQAIISAAGYATAP